MVALFAQHFTIRPWEMDLLTYTEFCALEQAALEIAKGGRGG